MQQIDLSHRPLHTTLPRCTPPKAPGPWGRSMLAAAFIVFISFSSSGQGGVGINNPTPHASALLDLTSTNKGLLTPRMSSAQRTAIASPATGLLVFDTTVNSFYFYNGTVWMPLTSGSTGWALNGNSGTTPASNYVGTNDMSPLAFRIGLVNAGRLDFTNTWLGFQSGNSVPSGTQNSFYGNGSGMSTTTGSNNTFIGTNSGAAASTGSNNTFLGTDAGYNHGIGSGNTLIGRSAGYNNGTGTNNTYIGFGAGGVANLTNASALGYSAVVSASNSLVLGGTGANAANVGIGITAPVSKLHVTRASSGYAPNANSALTVEHSGNVYMNVLSGSGESGLLFGSSSNAANGGVLYNSGFTPNGMQLRTGGNTARMSISSTGDVTVADNASWPGYRFGVIANQPTAMVAMQNLGPTGYSGIHFYNDANTAKAHVGVGNTASPNWVNAGYAGTWSAHPFILTTNDLERMRIDVTGNVGIGTTAPTYATHIVRDAAASSPVGIQNLNSTGVSGVLSIGSGGTVAGVTGWANGGNSYAPNTYVHGSLIAQSSTFITNSLERMRIDASGNVGIGTTSPSVKLDVVDGNWLIPMRVKNTLNNGYSMTQYLSSTNQIGHIGWGNAGAATHAGEFYLGTSSSVPLGFTTGDVERMRIDVAGNVGIGTSAPAFDLDIASTAQAVERLTSSSAPTGSVLELKNSSAGTNALGAVNFNDAANTYPGQVAYHPTGGLTLRSGGTARVAVMPSGRVGVGTLAPNAELEVNGYTMLGSTAPAVKMLKLTSTTAAVQGGTVNIPHGVNGTKILAVNVYVEYATNNFLPSGYSQNPGYEFNFLFNTTNITVFNTNTNSANILSKPIRILITYEQ